MSRSIPRLIFDVLASVVGILLFGGFILAFMGRYVPPTRMWWLQLLGPLLPVYAVMIAGAFAVSVLVRNWPMATIFVLCLSFFVLRHLPTGFGASAVDAERHAPVTILTFNARLIMNADDAEAASRDLDGIDPHVVAMQESPLRLMADQEDGIFMSRQVGLVMASTRTELPVIELTEEGTQLPVLSRLQQISNVEEIHSREGVVIATRSEFEHQGRRFAVYNVHLHSFRRDGMITDAGSSSDTISVRRTLREDFLIRMNEAVELRRILDGETLPFILCADLNSTPDNWIYRYISRGLTDAQRRAGKGFGGTFPSPLPLARIDYIFFSRHWDVHDAQALPIIMSDHRPVVARASLRSD